MSGASAKRGNARTTGQHIAICNERFLARFGVDRILVLFGDHMIRAGHRVTFVCLRCDRDVLEGIGADVRVLDLPDGIDISGADRAVRQQLSDEWDETGFDSLVIGGWPFFGVAAHAEALGAKAVFIDAGAVPQDGMPDAALPVQRELRRLRQATLPAIDTVLPISRFIRDSQTLPDRGSAERVETILLGADHMERPAFGMDAGRQPDGERALLDEMDDRRTQGVRYLIALGRAEPSGYKNSSAGYEVFRRIVSGRGELRLVMLGGGDDVEVPDDITDSVDVLGRISDAGLQGVMERCELGLSTSLWEGFNLPLAEMQWLGRPALAFPVGAHPEVVASPWFLCASMEAMADKAARLLDGGVPEAVASTDPFDRFRTRFQWRDALDRWAAHATSPPVSDGARRLVVIDVSNSARDTANSGVIRVTRRLASFLVRDERLDVVFVRWNEERGEYERLGSANRELLGSYAGPNDWTGPMGDAFGVSPDPGELIEAADPRSSRPPVLFLPEIALDDTATRRLEWGRERGFRTAFILYDMLPVYAKKYVDDAVVEAFPNYLDAMTTSDAVFAISRHSLEECERWHVGRGSRLPERREAVWLPGQFSDHRRVERHRATNPADGTVNILCVSTIEPRKNHRTLIEAYRALRKRRPDLRLRLDLVGNSYGGGAGLADWVRAVCRADPSVTWHGAIPDDRLAERYEAADFTVYPSLTEGFGLPILESLWMGRPCVCHEDGVMAELARDGGCLSVDMHDAASVADALERMATDGELRGRLTSEAMNRSIDTWRSYAETIAGRLAAL